MPFIPTFSSRLLIWVLFLTHPFVLCFGWWEANFSYIQMGLPCLAWLWTSGQLCISLPPVWGTVLSEGLHLGILLSLSSAAFGIPWPVWVMPALSLGGPSCLLIRAPSCLPGLRAKHVAWHSELYITNDCSLLLLILAKWPSSCF